MGLPPNKNGSPEVQGGPGANGQKFPREMRLVRRGEFDAVYRAGKRRSSPHFTVFFRANELPHSRFGFSIKRELGGAVVRNRMRRRLREIVRCHRMEIPAGWDVVIHPKSAVAKAEFAALTADLLRLLKSMTQASK
ncbi:MAG TPA: ribonuclease P protein component [Candidatus Acidoferrum sp.]|nr:ribonuclease P protein component [Candidatus Acidoferrum sp.]